MAITVMSSWRQKFSGATYVISLVIFDHAPEAPEVAVPGMMPYTLLDFAACVKGEVNTLLEIRNASYPHISDTYSPILATATWTRFAASSSAATAADSAEANAGMATGTKTPMIVKTAPIIKSASCPMKFGVAELCFLKLSSTLSEIKPVTTVPLNRAVWVSC